VAFSVSHKISMRYEVITVITVITVLAQRRAHKNPSEIPITRQTCLWTG